MECWREAQGQPAALLSVNLGTTWMPAGIWSPILQAEQRAKERQKGSGGTEDGQLVGGRSVEEEENPPAQKGEPQGQAQWEGVPQKRLPLPASLAAPRSHPAPSRHLLRRQRQRVVFL